MASGSAQRRIFFHRLLHSESWRPVSREAICDAIKVLSGRDAYFGQGDAPTRAEVYDDARPQCIRFFKIRRTELPSVDDGEGNQADLGLAGQAGLAEAIHLRLFPNGVVAVESFAPGPRETEFAQYVSGHLGIPCAMEAMVRHNVADEALRNREAPLATFKFTPSATSLAVANPAGMRGAMKVAKDLHEEVRTELTLRSNEGEESLPGQIKNRLTDVFKRPDHDASPAAEAESGSSPHASLELLLGKLYRVVDIPYRAGRTKELDAVAAFSAIGEAYEAVKSELPKDAQS